LDVIAGELPNSAGSSTAPPAVTDDCGEAFAGAAAISIAIASGAATIRNTRLFMSSRFLS